MLYGWMPRYTHTIAAKYTNLAPLRCSSETVGTNAHMAWGRTLVA